MAKRKKTLGQIAAEGANVKFKSQDWNALSSAFQERWERAAAAVEAEVLRRIGMTAEEAKAFEAIQPKRKRT